MKLDLGEPVRMNGYCGLDDNLRFRLFRYFHAAASSALDLLVKLYVDNIVGLESLISHTLNSES